MITPVILSGGSGTRLWPLSRKAYPKQFLPLMGQESLFAATVRRLGGDLFGPPMVLSNEEHRFLVAEALQGEGVQSTIILEPVGRNTAAACITATLQAMAEGADPLLLIAPSDHVMQRPQSFVAALRSAVPAAEAGAIVTFGITPTEPHTGSGYIETGGQGAGSVVEVTAFHEKPDLATAEGYLASGRYYWNGGIFLFRASTMLTAFETHAPDILAQCQKALSGAVRDLDFIRLPLEAYAAVRDISLDYAIIEKASNIKCMPLDAGWDDLGSWSSLINVIDRDENGNAFYGDVIAHDAHNSLAYSDSGCVALVGVDNAVVVKTRDATLVTTRERAQEVKAIVDAIKKSGRTEADYHMRVHRPWGWYEQLAIGARFQVKCIMVKPGAQLSLQSHMHRAEHWVVVTGTIEVTKGDEVILLTENQSTYIPVGTVHRMANRGKMPAFLIEVQSGSYLGEDDIIRYEDIYGRS